MSEKNIRRGLELNILGCMIFGLLLSALKEITEYSEELFDAHVETIKVISREEIQFNLRCGLVLTERLG